jgi:hypothetical protein
MNYRIIYNVLKHRILRFDKKDWRVTSADGITSAEFLNNIIKFFNDDEEVMLHMLLYSYKNLNYVSNRLKDNEQFLRNLFDTSDNFLGEDIVYVSERLKDDENFIRYALSKKTRCFNLASPRLLDNKELVTIALGYRGEYFQFISERLRGDFDIFMLAFDNSHKIISNILLYATEKITGNREYVLKIAGLKNKNMIHYLPEHYNYRSDKEIMSIFVKSYSENIKLCSFDLLQDIDYILELIKINPISYCHLRQNQDLFNNIKIIKFTLEQDGSLLYFIPEEFTYNYDCVLTAVKQNGSALNHAPDIFKKDLNIVFAAIEQRGSAYKYIDESLKENKEILIKTLAHGPKQFGILPKHIHTGEFRTFIQNQVILHQAFITFLLGLFPFAKNKSKLLKLNHNGTYDDLIFKKMISDYCGVTLGKSWLEVTKVAKIYKII